MKFSCPECHARYQVDLPTVGDAGVEVKCARCEHTFHVHEDTPSAVAAGSSSEKSGGDFSSPMAQQEAEPSPLDDNLDAFLDDLIEQENSSTNSSLEEPEPTAADTSLDGLLDDLLTEDSPGEEASDLEDQELDKIWQDSVEEGLKEEETYASESPPDTEKGLPAEPPTPPEAVAEETVSEDELWNEAFADQALQESKQSEPESADQATEVPDMNNMSEEDAWAAAFADQEATETKQEDSTKDPPPESAETVDMDNMSEEDAWAAAFADQEATETKQEDSTEAPPPESAETVDMDNMSEEDAWAAAFADQEATETKQEGDSGTASETGDSEEETEEDLWAKAFEDQAAVEETQQSDPAEEKAETAADTSEEDLWEQAFQETRGADAGEDAGETASAVVDTDASEPTADNAMGGEVSDEEMEKLAALAHDEADGPSLADEALANYNEDDYADFDDDEFETETPVRKKGFIPLPSGKTGKLVVGGGIIALLLIAGSAYFAIQTFAPPELVEEGQMAEVESEQEATEETSNAEGEEGAAGEAENGPSAVEEAQNALLNEEEAKPAAEASTETSATEEPAGSSSLNAALTPFADIVEMSTILPVAFSPTDIKVLSFTIRLEMDTPGTADNMRESLPVYEKIMVSTVENFLKRKFYNDILYVKEKLSKRLERAINKGLKQGKIKKAKFKDFQIS